MRKRRLRILKANGAIEQFSQRKLVNSIRRTGLSEKESQSIGREVSKTVSEGVRTKDIYRKALHLVKQHSPIAAARYSLKKALFDLGPTGHHFEIFVAKYFQHLGYMVSTCLTLRGKFVNHEVDVIATKNGRRLFVECKFHNRIGIKNDIKTALYVKARWDDLKEGPEGKKLDSFYIASNTAFSLDALTYAKGTGLKLLGVNAPNGRSFLDEIEDLHLYPITSLRRLNRSIASQLLDKDIILAEEIPRHTNLLYRLGMDETEIHRLLEEVKLLKGNSL